MYRILESFGDAVQVYKFPHCGWDEWAHQFYKAVSTPRAAQSMEAKSWLQSLAVLVDVDIADVECSHSSVREWTRQKGRGHTPSLSEVSARTLCRWVQACHGHELKSNVTEADSTDAAHAGVESARAVKRTGAGGAFRAFISKHAKGHRMTSAMMRELANRYRALTHDEKQVYRELGLLMTLKSKYEGLKLAANVAPAAASAAAAAL